MDFREAGLSQVILENNRYSTRNEEIESVSCEHTRHFKQVDFVLKENVNRGLEAGELQLLVSDEYTDALATPSCS
jgi:hypothetical protein